MLALLKSAQANQTLGQFQFKDSNGAETYRVRIVGMAGAEIGGRKGAALFDLTLIAP